MNHEGIWTEYRPTYWDGWSACKRLGDLVRCKDCRHMHTVRSWLGMDVNECWLHADRESGALGKEPTEPDGFCAWGERRESE